MKLPLYQVDAFSKERFGGNPAAVVLLDDWLDDDVLQSIATENNLSETAFVRPKNGRFAIRWFTPQVEIDLCGHATLGSAYVLFEHGRVAGDKVEFDSPGGRLVVHRDGDRLMMDFPSHPAHPVEITEEMVLAFRCRPQEAHEARDLMLVYERESQISALLPLMDRIEAMDSFAVIVTAPGTDCDFVSRFFAPGVGIPEDPVTGSAHCTLIPYWSKRLGKTSLYARQLSERGGEIFCENRGDRVLIGGHVAEYLRGEITI